MALRDAFIVREGNNAQQYIDSALQHAQRRYGLDGPDLQKLRDQIMTQFTMGQVATSEPPEEFVDRLLNRRR
jgi:hypothetical protein